GRRAQRPLPPRSRLPRPGDREQRRLSAALLPREGRARVRRGAGPQRGGGGAGGGDPDHGGLLRAVAGRAAARGVRPRRSPPRQQRAPPRPPPRPPPPPPPPPTAPPHGPP